MYIFVRPLLMVPVTTALVVLTMLFSPNRFTPQFPHTGLLLAALALDSLILGARYYLSRQRVPSEKEAWDAFSRLNQLLAPAQVLLAKIRAHRSKFTEGEMDLLRKFERAELAIEQATERLARFRFLTSDTQRIIVQQLNAAAEALDKFRCDLALKNKLYTLPPYPSKG
jgi:hypothetical protein